MFIHNNNISIQIASAPLFEGNPLEEIVLIVGDHAVLHCRLREGVEARIEWNWNGRELSDGETVKDSSITVVFGRYGMY